MRKTVKDNVLDIIKSLNINKNAIGLMLSSSLCLCIGQLLWKKIDISMITDNGLHIESILFGLLLFLPGFLVYALGAVFMLVAFRKGDLSVLQPMNSMSYVFSLILSVTILQEAVTGMMIIGVIIIMAGVFLVGGSAND